MQNADLFVPGGNKQRLDQRRSSGRSSTNSLMRASNLTVPTVPTLRPKLRKVARVGDELRLKQLTMGQKHPAVF